MRVRVVIHGFLLIGIAASSLYARDISHNHFAPYFDQAGPCRRPFCYKIFKPWIMHGQSFDDPLVADRPDFTESSSVVGRRRLQIEGGYTFFLDGSGGVVSRDHLLPELLFRYGLNDSLEFRVGWPGHLFSSQKAQEDLLPFETSGGTGMNIGFKSQFTDQDGCLPEFGLIYHINLPVGDPDVGTDRVGVSLVAAYSWELNDRVSIAGNTGGYFIAPGGDYFNSVTQSIALSFKITKRLGIFQEWFMLAFTEAEDSRPEQYYNGGFTYLITPNFQLDCKAGVGLSEAAADFFTGTGFAVRW